MNALTRSQPIARPLLALVLCCMAAGGWAQTAVDKATAAAEKAALAAETAASAAKSAAKSVDELKAGYAADEDRFDGDKLTLRTRVVGFADADVPDDASWCAPSESELKVTREVGDALLLRFTRVGGGKAECAAGSKIVNTFMAFRITKSRLTQTTSFRRTGVTFGALIVPFKFRTGDKEIVSSATVAPYVGWRTGWFGTYGLSFTPLFSAGLGLVPVTNPASGTTETRSAFSMATGIVMGSSKNEAFQAGFLIGRDFLGRSDAQLDPGSKKVWLSFYVGYTLSQN
jgi:hypothetical protein